MCVSVCDTAVHCSVCAGAEIMHLQKLRAEILHRCGSNVWKLRCGKYVRKLTIRFFARKIMGGWNHVLKLGGVNRNTQLRKKSH